MSNPFGDEALLHYDVPVVHLALRFVIPREGNPRREVYSVRLSDLTVFFEYPWRLFPPSSLVVACGLSWKIAGGRQPAPRREHFFFSTLREGEVRVASSHDT
mgnify:CR=1 FL=1